MTHKICKKCGGNGPFTKCKKHKDGLFPFCKICKNKQTSEYRQKNKSKFDKYRKTWLENNKEQQRIYTLKRYHEYRLTSNGRATHLLVAARRRVGSDKVTIKRETIITILENGYCQRTGLKFDLETPHNSLSPSLDRTDPSKWYTPENTKVVVLIYNTAKGEWKHSDVLRLAISLVGQVSIGDLIDRISILEIKSEKITDPLKLQNVNKELLISRLALTNQTTDDITNFMSQLKEINQQIWNIEDDIRDCERRGQFGNKFVQLARSVYLTNDKRAALKKEINVLFNSDIMEEKSYTEYITQVLPSLTQEISGNAPKQDHVKKCNQLIKEHSERNNG